MQIRFFSRRKPILTKAARNLAHILSGLSRTLEVARRRPERSAGGLRNGAPPCARSDGIERKIENRRDAGLQHGADVIGDHILDARCTSDIVVDRQNLARIEASKPIVFADRDGPLGACERRGQRRFSGRDLASYPCAA
ncbi:hypothetical protein ACPUER_06435 [Burkholderia sp. DN3021]|uniref:hypothetical protein n=1 Tax=Burkholderia sp. DN3021 TaxID=3410137 RepID=UPI003C7CC2F7